MENNIKDCEAQTLVNTSFLGAWTATRLRIRIGKPMEEMVIRQPCLKIDRRCHGADDIVSFRFPGMESRGTLEEA